MTSLWCRIVWATCQQSTSPATTVSRVNEVLTQPLNIMETLGLNESVCVFAQVFYIKTADITWKDDQFKNIIFRIVAFHVPYHLKHPISTIGKMFQYAGLLDLCVGFGVISEGSITDVIEGHKYNRVARLHKIV